MINKMYDHKNYGRIYIYINQYTFREISKIFLKFPLANFYKVFFINKYNRYML